MRLKKMVQNFVHGARFDTQLTCWVHTNKVSNVMTFILENIRNADVGIAFCIAARYRILILLNSCYGKEVISAPAENKKYVITVKITGNQLPPTLPTFLGSMQGEGIVEEEQTDGNEHDGAPKAELPSLYSTQDQAMMQDCYSKIVEKLSVANPAMVLQVGLKKIPLTQCDSRTLAFMS